MNTKYSKSFEYYTSLMGGILDEYIPWMSFVKFFVFFIKKELQNFVRNEILLVLGERAPMRYSNT